MGITRVRSLAEVALPGAAVGLVTGVIAGGLAILVGQPTGWAATTALTLGIPLALLGGGYGLLIAHEKVRLGGFAPVALYWLIGFPLARLFQEVVTGLVLAGRPRIPPDLLGFLAYQALVSAGFAIGFLWLHERVAPHWWRRVAGHNPLAEQVFARYAAYATALWEAKQARRRRARTSKP
jgi:hypothetical protein